MIEVGIMVATGRRRWLAAAALALTMGVAMSAHAALRAIADHPRLVIDVPAAQAGGFEAQDHFPGAALLYTMDDPAPAQAAPAAGVTGTTMLPDLPIPPTDSASTVETGVVAAAPFRMGRATSIDRGRALECLTAALYYEAASEPDAGQRAVAQVILNRVRHPAFPASVCGVVYQGSERAGCQFSFACDGAMARVPARAAWQRAMRTAGAALAGYVYAPVGLATHYHTYAVTPAWNRSLVMTDAVGAHFFHRWKGYWGSPAAFRQPYAGSEPLPGPHRALAGVEGMALLPVVASAPATGPIAPTTTSVAIRDTDATSGTPIGPRPPVHLPEESQVLDKWKDSGTPLR